METGPAVGIFIPRGIRGSRRGKYGRHNVAANETLLMPSFLSSQVEFDIPDDITSDELEDEEALLREIEEKQVVSGSLLFDECNHPIYYHLTCFSPRRLRIVPERTRWLQTLLPIFWNTRRTLPLKVCARTDRLAANSHFLVFSTLHSWSMQKRSLRCWSGVQAGE